MKDEKGHDLPSALIHYLKSLGIIVRKLKCDTEKSSSNGLVFGNPLHVLPQYSLPDGNGTIPRFLVEACSFLSQHLQTEGLFRKSGSAIRMKNLKAKLQQGDCSLEFTSASDVAGLLKQFFRELPEPIIPAGFQGPLCQAQQLQAEGERGAATVLLTCLMPRINAATMNYFLSFLQTVAARSEENKMGVHNLAVIFTPNLFQLFDANDKLPGNMEKMLPLLTMAAETLIIRAQSIGHLPPCILDKLPVLLDAGAVCVLSSGDSLDEGRQMLRVKPRKKPRRSVGVIVSGALSKLKTSITPQSDRTSVAPLQQRISPAANTLLTAKRKANDNVSTAQGSHRKRVCCQAEGIESPSIFLKPSLEGATVSAGGSKTPPTSSVMGRGSRRAACKQTQRVLPKREASPWHLHHQKKSIGKSLQCFGFNRGKDSKFNLPLNLTSKEVRATCCDLLTPSVAGSLDGSPLAGTNVLLTPVTQRSDPLDRELVNRHELENYASHHLSQHLNFNTLLEAELSKSEGALLQDSPGLQISPSASAFEAKKPQQPNVADTPIHSIESGMAECDQPWRGHNDIFKLDVGSSIGNNISTPYFVQVPHDSSVSICKIVRRSLSLPEAISESKGNKISEEGVKAGFVEDPDIYLKTLGSSIDTSSAAVDENSLNINREHKNLSVPSVEACHPSIEVKGRSKGMNGNSEMTQELPMPFIVLAEEDHVENCALNSLYDTGDRFRSAEKCILGFCDPLSHTSEKSSPQPSIMEMARSSVTECIRKLNKLSGKRRSLKHNFLKVPAGSKQTPHHSSGLRFAQHADTLFGKKPEGYKHQEARQPVRRSLSLESALHVCKDLKGLDDDHASKHDVNDTSPETNNPDCSGISDQYLFSRKKYLALHSPQRKMSRLSPVRRPVLEDRRKQMSPDKSGTEVGPH